MAFSIGGAFTGRGAVSLPGAGGVRYAAGRVAHPLVCKGAGSSVTRNRLRMQCK